MRRAAGLLAAGRLATALLGAVAVVLLPAAPGHLLSRPAAAASPKPCVGVIVDARLLGGAVRTGCAEGDPGSGLQALTRAGFSYAFLPRQPGLVCQVDRQPECARTSTTTYWSYWHRAKGATRWTYSTVGAAAHDPQPGSTEAWVWQEGGRRTPPDIGLRTLCPQAFAAPRSSTPRPTPSTSPSRRTSKASTSGTATGATGSRSPRAGATPGTATPSTGEATTGEAGGGPTGRGTTGGGPTSTSRPAAGQATGDPGDGAPVLGLALGAGLVAAVAGAAVVRARRSGSP